MFEKRASSVIIYYLFPGIYLPPLIRGKGFTLTGGWTVCKGVQIRTTNVLGYTLPAIHQDQVQTNTCGTSGMSQEEWVVNYNCYPSKGFEPCEGGDQGSVHKG